MFQALRSTRVRVLSSITLLAAGALALSGCTTIESAFTKNGAEIQAATNLAVGEAILAQKTPAGEAALAKLIVSGATKAQADVSSTVTVAALVAAAQAELVKVGNPQEVLAANTLLATLEPILVQYVGNSVLSPTAVVDLQTFCGWVITAATPYTSS